MTDPTSLRVALPSDVETIVRHRRLMFSEMGIADAAALDAMATAAATSLREGLEDGSYRGWLIEAQGRVVAGGGLVIFNYQPSPSEPVSRRAAILNMHTEADWRRRGLARQLMEQMISWCRAKGFRAVSLHASDEGRPLYAALGFEPTNEMRLMLGGESSGR
ncbi:MAG: GNAT family N-acetyltransferase [Candidatus Eisenbacteria bacterium]